MLDEDQTSGVDENTENTGTTSAEQVDEPTGVAEEQPEAPAPVVVTTVTTTRRKAAGRPAGPPTTGLFSAPLADPLADEETAATLPSAPQAMSGLMFQAPPEGLAPALPKPEPVKNDDRARGSQESASDDADSEDNELGEDGEPKRRRRSRGGRRRRKNEDGDDNDSDSDDSSNSESADSGNDNDDESGDENGSTRRRRRRARAGEEAVASPDDPENTVVKVREGRSAEDEISGVSGSTRLEAKKQRRREGREAGRRRAPIVSEAEFLARRESVDREMIVRQSDDYTQIAVLEDKVLVEHYVARESQTSLIGNVYLGKVQNVLPSMEAAFVDIGAARNAVIYAGEVDWSNVPNGKQRKIEDALEPGQTVLVQVTKDPIGQKGARLTSQVSLPGRFLVYVPGGGNNGISRKLPENERARLKELLKEALPESAGVIVRTAAEGATEEQLTRDVTALTARWEDIEKKAAEGKAPQLLYSEPDLIVKVIRDLFNEDFARLVVQGDDAFDMVSGYLAHVAPDLAERVERWDADQDVFAQRRVDEQIKKALDRKVNLPSGGSLVIDRTEAMVVVDVNTGRFTGSGGNLEETVTKNNLEAAEEIVRQMRLRDLGGIIVIDFIDMVLESNRDLVLRRLVECLGRDRTRHQVAEVTSLGLVQMTRKRIGTGLHESFGHECETCKGTGVLISDTPVEPKKDEGPRRGRRGGKNNQNKQGNQNQGNQNQGGQGKKQGKNNKQDNAQQENVQKDAVEQDNVPSEASAQGETVESAVTPSPVVVAEVQQEVQIELPVEGGSVVEPQAEAATEMVAETTPEPTLVEPVLTEDGAGS